MLDAASCGVPIVISQNVQAKERVEGNGFTYIENDFQDLSNVILRLKDKSLRKTLGDFGKQKIENEFSWIKIAKDRQEDYQFFVNNKIQ